MNSGCFLMPALKKIGITRDNRSPPPTIHSSATTANFGYISPPTKDLNDQDMCQTGWECRTPKKNMALRLRKISKNLHVISYIRTTRATCWLATWGQWLAGHYWDSIAAQPQQHCARSASRSSAGSAKRSSPTTPPLTRARDHGDHGDHGDPWTRAILDILVPKC